MMMMVGQGQRGGEVQIAIAQAKRVTTEAVVW